ncbi:MAG: right-handed parallel beta-helix repeat-containing protein [Planctomycetota bacterium]
MNQQAKVRLTCSADDPSDHFSDQSFSSLGKARDAIRKLKSTRELPSGGLHVVISSGRYELDEPLQLGPKDAGTADSPITWRADDDGEVVLSGGRQLEDFQPVTDQNVLLRLPERARGHVVCADLADHGIDDLGHPITPGQRPELFIDHEAMPLARWPKNDFCTVRDVEWIEPFDVRGTRGDRVGHIMYQGDRPVRWMDEPDAWLHGYWFWDWSDGYQRIDTIDPERNVIELEPPHHNYGYRPGMRYYAVNLLCELSEPGEWYIDRDSATLYLWPPDSVENHEIILSTADHLIQACETSHLNFRDLVLETTRSEAIQIAGGEACSVVDCEIRNVGADAVTIRNGSEHTVKNCHIYNPGKGGVVMSGGDRASLTPSEHVAEDNHIHHFSRVQRTYTPAIKLEGVGSVARGNHIHDAPHNAIQISGNEHLIQNNEIHHVCEETGDVGAFYICARDWTERGHVVDGNFFHHISGPGMGGARTVYLDDFSSGFLVQNNLFYKTTQAIHVGGGRDNLVKYNIFVDCDRAIHVDARGSNWARYHIDPIEPEPSDGQRLPDKLHDIPINESPWTERYPELTTILDSEPNMPVGTRIHNNIIVGENWDDVSDTARPFVELENNFIDDGWMEVCSCPFSEESDLDRWEIADGTPEVTADGLETSSPTTLVTTDKWAIPLRIEYQARAENPGDFSAFLGDQWEDGLLLQYGGQDNTLSRIVARGEELLRTDATIDNATWEAIRWVIREGSACLAVDGADRFSFSHPGINEAVETPTAVGLYLHQPAQIRNIIIERYAPADCIRHIAGTQKPLWPYLRKNGHDMCESLT